MQQSPLQEFSVSSATDKPPLTFYATLKSPQCSQLPVSFSYR